MSKTKRQIRQEKNTKAIKFISKLLDKIDLAGIADCHPNEYDVEAKDFLHNYSWLITNKSDVEIGLGWTFDEMFTGGVTPAMDFITPPKHWNTVYGTHKPEYFSSISQEIFDYMKKNKLTKKDYSFDKREEDAAKATHASQPISTNKRKTK